MGVGNFGALGRGTMLEGMEKEGNLCSARPGRGPAEAQNSEWFGLRAQGCRTGFLKLETAVA
jgi:hypothetical protein